MRFLTFHQEFTHSVKCYKKRYALTLLSTFADNPWLHVILQHIKGLTKTERSKIRTSFNRILPTLFIDRCNKVCLNSDLQLPVCDKTCITTVLVNCCTHINRFALKKTLEAHMFILLWHSLQFGYCLTDKHWGVLLQGNPFFCTQNTLLHWHQVPPWCVMSSKYLHRISKQYPYNTTLFSSLAFYNTTVLWFHSKTAIAIAMVNSKNNIHYAMNMNSCAPNFGLWACL